MQDDLKPSRLQEEIQQTRPFQSRRQEAFLAILRSADLLRRGVGALLEPFGVTPQQYNVLRILRGAGPEGLPVLAIGARLIEHTPGMTRLLQRLEAKGWVERRRNTGDRRQVDCRLTPAGAELLARIDPVMEQADRHMLASLNAGQLDALIALLDDVRANPGI
jgi:MarR family transcriptional regulator, organic hydroperoxide resistance regulator